VLRGILGTGFVIEPAHMQVFNLLLTTFKYSIKDSDNNENTRVPRLASRARVRQSDWLVYSILRSGGRSSTLYRILSHETLMHPGSVDILSWLGYWPLQALEQFLHV
jgi:hypothetical protein